MRKDTANRPSADHDHVVALLAPDPVNLFEFSVACEVFGLRRPELTDGQGLEGWYSLRVCAAEPGAEVDTGMGFSIRPTRGLDGLHDADTVIVPMTPRVAGAAAGGPLTDPIVPRASMVEAVTRASTAGARVVSFCSGAFTLAEAGLLDGRRATTHWLYQEEFRRRYPTVEVVPDVLYVDEGDVLTSAGSAAAIDLSLHIVRQDHGADVADIVARRMVVPPHRDGGQAQYTRVPAPGPRGPLFAELLDWAVDHLDEPLTVADLAERAAMSKRSFARKFRQATGTTPLAWLTDQRVALARQLLETTDLTVDSVATRSGLGTAANLRTRLRDACGVSPSAYRQRFRRATA